jgi:hypothetical protein
MTGSPDDLRNTAGLDLTDIRRQARLAGRPDELLFELRTAVAVYRRQVLPHLERERELVLPAMTTGDRALATGYARIVADELGRRVGLMEDVQAELLAEPGSDRIQARAIALLGAAGALATVAARFGGEVLLPRFEQ